MPWNAHPEASGTVQQALPQAADAPPGPLLAPVERVRCQLPSAPAVSARWASSITFWAGAVGCATSPNSISASTSLAVRTDSSQASVEATLQEAAGAGLADGALGGGRLRAFEIADPLEGRCRVEMEAPTALTGPGGRA